MGGQKRTLGHLDLDLQMVVTTLMRAVSKLISELFLSSLHFDCFSPLGRFLVVWAMKSINFVDVTETLTASTLEMSSVNTCILSLTNENRNYI